MSVKQAVQAGQRSRLIRKCLRGGLKSSSSTSAISPAWPQLRQRAARVWPWRQVIWALRLILIVSFIAPVPCRPAWLRAGPPPGKTGPFQPLTQRY
ncbi:hypothetical protein GT370_13680 [Acidocella sp. MX-AZ03]|nr:hypothetical protein [Acidocella sp. MX-AZ03]WBO58254.1 hypothetical protein GT370_13680 [Acidocella sp. MX-AZ03]